MARLAQLEGLDMATRKMEYAPSEGPAALLAAFDASVAAAREMLASLDEARGNGIWRMTFGNREIFAVSKTSGFVFGSVHAGPSLAPKTKPEVLATSGAPRSSV
jgi:hypothetical protein